MCIHSQNPSYIVRAQKTDTTLIGTYCFSEKEARRAINLYCSISDVVEVVAFDYMTLELVSHWVRKGHRSNLSRSEYGIF